MHIELPLAAFASTLLLVIPARRFSVTEGVAAVSLVVWLVLTNIIFGVDALMWIGNVDVIAPVWCDLTTKLITGTTMAIPASCLCICVGIARRSGPVQKRSLPDTLWKRRIMELSLSVLLPLVYMSLHCVVQNYRFEVIEDIGCRSSTLLSSPAIVLMWIPPWIVSIVTIFFAWFGYRNLARTSDVESTTASVTMGDSSDWHLLSMALVITAWSTLVSTLSLDYAVLKGDGVLPWPGLATAHRSLGSVDIFPKVFASAGVRSLEFLLWWGIPVTSITVVLFVGIPEACAFIRKRRSSEPRANPLKHLIDVEKGRSISSDQRTAVASPVSTQSTIRFGEAPHEFFTVPDFGLLKNTESTTIHEPAEQTSYSTRPAPALPVNLTSFLPLSGPEERGSYAHSTFTELESHDVFVSAPLTEYPRDTHSVIASTHDSFISSRKPSDNHSVILSAHSSLFTRNPSVPSSCLTTDPRHISISSVRYPESVRTSFPAVTVPSSPTSLLLSERYASMLELQTPVSRSRLEIDGSEYQLEPIPPLPKRPSQAHVGNVAKSSGLDRGKNGSIYMTMVKERT